MQTAGYNGARTVDNLTVNFWLFSATFAPYSSVNYRYTDKVRSLFGNQEHVTNYKQFWKFIEDDLIEGRVLTFFLLAKFRPKVVKSCFDLRIFDDCGKDI